jgi:26S proteasome non-ATPase regulatory subunit 10
MHPFTPFLRHRAATTGSAGFIRLLLDSSTASNKLRLNTGDRIGKSPAAIHIISASDNLALSVIGNTPLHLAMDSAHADAAVLLINAGADRGRVGFLRGYLTAVWPDNLISIS